jgi:hypothetical protein
VSRACNNRAVSHRSLRLDQHNNRAVIGLSFDSPQEVVIY